MSTLAPVNSIARFVNPDGTLTPTAVYFFKTLYERVGGSHGSGVEDVFAPFVTEQAPMESVQQPTPQERTYETVAAAVPAYVHLDAITQPTPLTAGTGLSLLDYKFSLADTAVTPATYGSASKVAQFTVDQQGRLTFAQDVTISIAPSQMTGGLNFVGDIAAAVTGKTTTITNGIWISVV